ncbi:transmembrane protein 214 [Hyalella azteca]|uniref:Transmembrane protein 214 n=1 Tax=Hyalella azteca TaxID=294128 RepID=A0A8B7P8U9_HYAAZ|nr:transmembrane protein 214 [Hyalella azteca]
MSEEWEVVGAPKKKPNGLPKDGKQLDGQADSKKGSKNPAPKAYDPKAIEKFKLIDKMADDDEMLFKDAVVTASKSSKTANKKNVPAKPKTLKEAVSKLNLSELQGLCKTLQTQFRSDHLVWLKDLASFLNLRLNPTTPVDSAYRQEPSSSAPLDYVSIPIREFLVRVVQGCSVTVLSQFHRHCFTSMLHEAMRGLSVHGFALFIQIINNVSREASVTHADDYIALREMYETHPRPGLTYVWLLSCTIETAVKAKHFQPAVKMWMEGLLPLVSSKQYGALVGQSAKDLAKGLENYQLAAAGKKSRSPPSDGAQRRSKAQGAVLTNYLLTLLEVAFASSTQIPRNINKQITELFAKMKVACCTTESCQLFPMLLPKLVPSCSPAMAQQIGSACELCLQSNDECWDVWLTMLPKQFMQSAKLVKLLGGESRFSGVFASSQAKSAINKIEQISADRMADNPQARELNREIKRIQVGVAAAASRLKRREEGRAGALRGLGSSVLSALFWVALLLAVVGYAAVSIDEHRAKFDSTLLGKMAAKFGVSEQVKGTVHVLAEHSTAVYKWSLERWGSAARVVVPAFTTARLHIATLLDAVGTKFPTLATLASTLREKLQGVWVAVYTLAVPYVHAAYDAVLAMLQSDGVSRALASVTNFTGRLMSVMFADNTTQNTN